MVYDVIVVEVPTPNEVKDGAVEKVLGRSESIVAKDQTAAALIAVQALDGEHDPNRLEVRFSPFA